MKTSHRYLLLPVNNSVPIQRISICAPGAEPYELDVKYDPAAPRYTAYIDISKFGDHGLLVTLADGSTPEYSIADKLPEDTYTEPYRPQVRFSVPRGWTNDPNGLVYAFGTWHMFFQHNPAGTEWGNMHWGHATSSDLLHWQYDGDVLFPDRLGTMFSGSAIVDERNVSGLGTGGYPPILLFYTAAGKPFTQCLAYSDDGGKTFKKYPHNPIVGHIAGDNRDPKVVWCDELDKYVMALYLDGSDFALLCSDNLLDWSEFQRLTLPGDAECPDFYPMLLDGRERKWVFSGASDRYFTGDIKDGRFVPDGPVKRLFAGDRESYAAQTFSGLPGYRRVRIAWNTTWHNFVDSPFSMSMTFPAELELRTIDGVPTLCASPVRDIERLFTDGEAAAYYAEFDAAAESPDAAVRVCGTEIPLPFTGRQRVQVILDRNGWELYTPGCGHYYVGGGPKDAERIEYGAEEVSARGATLQNISLHRLRSTLPVSHI
jgi:hypothetical protein